MLAASAIAIEGLLHLACALVPSVDRLGHPNSHGHAVIAAGVARWMEANR
jgi:hypothetical protein